MTLARCWIGFAAPLALCAAALAQNATNKRANVDSAGAQAAGSTYYDTALSISGDGVMVAFASNAANLVPNDTNGFEDVFVHNLFNGETELVSVDSSGVQGLYDSFHASISTNARFVAFCSQAPNLVPGDGNQALDIFVRDLVAGTTELVSLSTTGVQANMLCSHPSISADGRFVSFRSFASNLVPGDTNGWDDIFVRDRLLGLTTRVSVGEGGNQSHSNCGTSAISKDGRWVTFHCGWYPLVPGNVYSLVYVADLLTGELELIDVDPSGNPTTVLAAGWGDTHPAISDDGRYVSFRSGAWDLVPGDTNDAPDLFVRDRQTGTTTRVSVDSSGAQANGGCVRSAISATGRYVAFDSWASNLVPGDTNGHSDVFVHDQLTGQTSLASVGAGSAPGNGPSLTGTISPDGRFVAFNSLASNLLPGDTNAQVDVFVRELTGCTPTVAQYCAASGTSIPGCQAQLSGAGVPSLSSAGSFAIATGPIPGASVGIAYFGVSGPAAQPFGTQGGLLCVGTPLFRSGSKSGGGTSGACDGALSFTLLDLVVAQPALIQPAASVHVALWFRDPPSADGFALSSGLWFTACP